MILMGIKRFTKAEPFNIKEARRRIADKMIADGRFPIPRMALPEDIGRTAAALATGALPFSTGEFVNVDGGFHINLPAPVRQKT